ncbi:hypothetical protein [Paracoccus methylarcula]|uniref:hypothetical protein n=1 Tax=Paracoccus methylarcula TaxID=72022 RepID=UPI001B87445B
MAPTSAQSYDGDPRNDDALIYVNGDFVHRDRAMVSVFDAGFVLGDGVWEGLRLVNGRLLSLDAHLDRLFEGSDHHFVASASGHRNRSAASTASPLAIRSTTSMLAP